MHKLEDLKIWHRANDLVLLVYEFVREFPKDEQYGLTSQIKRSVISVASNIAEGAGRNGNAEFNQFLGIAVGSLYELQTQVLLASRLNFGTVEMFDRVMSDIITLQKMTYNLQERIQAKKTLHSLS